jgi:hypothetical protein
MEIKLRGGFGVREGVIEAGGSTITHAHNFPHVTYLLDPAAVELLEPLVSAPTKPEDFRVVKSVDKPHGGYVFVEAGKWHRIKAPSANSVHYHCMFVHRTPDAEISDEFDGWQPAYE